MISLTVTTIVVDVITAPEKNYFSLSRGATFATPKIAFSTGGAVVTSTTVSSSEPSLLSTPTPRDSIKPEHKIQKTNLQQRSWIQ